MRRNCNKPYIQYGENGETTYKNYEDLKRNLPSILKKHGTADVYRTRRGEWGQWWEKWVLVNDKPSIENQGWL